MEGGKGRIGTSFVEFLDEQGIREDVEGQAVKELIAEQIKRGDEGGGPQQGCDGGADAHDARPARSPSRSRQPVRHAGHFAAGGEGRGSPIDDSAELKLSRR